MQKIFNVTSRFKTLFLCIAIYGFQIMDNSVFAQISENQHKIRTIVIDAGHGGKDTGALGKHSKEKDVVLAVSLKAGKYIEEHLPDVKVIYTRDTDVFIPLHERSKIANDANADLFISIHANSNPNTNASGSETFAMGLHKTNENLEVAKKENSVIVFEDNYNSKYEGFDPNDVESYIMLSLMQNTYLEQSLNAASFVQTQFRDRVHRKDRGVKQAGFLVLWETSMPSILIELGFVSNLNEEQYLVSDSGQDYLASAIFRAFRNYKEYIEGPNTPATQVTIASPAPEVQKDNNLIEIPEAKNEIKESEVILIPAALNTIIDTDEIVYKVQILYSENAIKLDDTLFADFNDIEEIKIDGKYKYVVGAKSEYKEAVEYSKWVKSRHPDAFVVAVLNGKIIPLSQVSKETQQN